MKLLEEEQLSLNEVARQLHCHASSVMRWRNRIQEKGEAGFTAHSPPGRPASLSQQQKKQLVELLLQGPQAMAYRTDIWTTQRVA
jgi:transposase